MTKLLWIIDHMPMWLVLCLCLIGIAAAGSIAK